MIPTPIIPCISRRKNQVQYDKELYKRRNVVERFFLKIKAYRKIATRYEQTSRNYLSLLKLTARMVIMRSKTEDVL
jgi:transposase